MIFLPMEEVNTCFQVIKEKLCSEVNARKNTARSSVIHFLKNNFIALVNQRQYHSTAASAIFNASLIIARPSSASSCVMQSGGATNT